MLVYRALRTYLRRYARAAEGAGLADAAAHCRALAERPPSSFAEALQLMWIVGHVYCTMVSINPTLTFGRLDELLLALLPARPGMPAPSRGKQAGALITDFYCKNNLILGRGEHQMSGDSAKSTGWQRNLTYDAPQYIVLGGRRADGAAPGNELTELFLECVVPRFENPVVVLRYTPDLTGIALAGWPSPRCARTPACWSTTTRTVIPALERAGIAAAPMPSPTPCTAAIGPMSPGCSAARPTPGSGCRVTFWRPSWARRRPPRPIMAALDELYERFRLIFRAALEAECARFRASRARWEEMAPGRPARGRLLSGWPYRTRALLDGWGRALCHPDLSPLLVGHGCGLAGRSG